MATANPTPPDPPTDGRRRNRRWLLVLAATPLLVAVIGVLVSVLGPSEPTVALTPPPGFQAISDAYWAYAIPSAWRQDTAFTDATGDFFYTGGGGWVGETLRLRNDPPVLDEAPPITLASFGQVRPTPYSLAGGQQTHVAGADSAWSYSLVRGPTTVRVIDAWIRGARTEIWLVVHAAEPLAGTIASSLRA